MRKIPLFLFVMESPMRTIKMLGAVATMAAVSFLSTVQAYSESMTWRFRSYHENSVQVQVQVYSQWRPGHQWPTTELVWVLRDYDIHRMSISCLQGEAICYGAWVDGNTTSYWGTGYDGNQSCDRGETCCYVCDGGVTPVINLNQ